MPWKEVSTMSARQEFVMFATVLGVNVRQLCQRFGVSPKTGYKWLERYRREGPGGLADRSRRPHRSPDRTTPQVEQAVVALRDRHPAWGGRKIRARLLMLGSSTVPSVSTVTEILRRHGRLDPAESVKHTAWQRFEHETPNALWQMDFKGDFPLGQGRCYPLTILDDHSRFALGLRACDNQRGQTVRGHLQAVFERYGLPDRMLMDNGNPWGAQGMSAYTALSVWLIRLGIGVSHSRPYHPQTLGKDERFHRTLKAEVLHQGRWNALADCQHSLDRWREVYNLERPHQALGMTVPASRYHPSPRLFPTVLPPIEFGVDDLIRKVHHNGSIGYHRRRWRIGEAFRGLPVGLRPTVTEGLWEVYFCRERIRTIDLRQTNPEITESH